MMTLKQIVRLNFLAGVVLIAVVAAVILDENGNCVTPQTAGNKVPSTLESPVVTLDVDSGAGPSEDGGTIKRAFLYCLVRTTFLYLYTVFCIYYIILMEEHQLLPEPYGFVGKLLIFITIVGYLLVEVAAPSDKVFVIVVRIGVVLVIFTTFQIVHLMWWAFYSCSAALGAEPENCCGKFMIVGDGETARLVNDQEVPDEEEFTTEL